MDKSKWTDRLPDLMEGYTEAEPEGLWEAVQAGMTPRRRVAAGWWYAAGSLAAAAAVVLAVFLWQPGKQTVSPVPEDRLVANGDTLPVNGTPDTSAVVPAVPADALSNGQERSFGPRQFLSGGSRIASNLPAGTEEAPAEEQIQPEMPQNTAEKPDEVQNRPDSHQNATDNPAEEQKQPEMHLEPERWPDAVPQTRKKGGGMQLSVTSGGLMAQAGTITRNGFGLPDTPAANGPVAAPRALFSSVHRNKASSSEAKHWQNFRAGLLVNYAFLPRWSVETGLQYTSLQARETTQSGNGSVVKDRHFNYLGIPLNLQFKPLEVGQFSLYLSAGPMYEFLAGGRERSQTFTGGMLSFEDEPHALDTRDRRWSLNAGVGLQWQPLRFGALFIQPGVSWHFPGGENAPETFYSVRPVAFDLVFGARILLR